MKYFWTTKEGDDIEVKNLKRNHALNIVKRFKPELYKKGINYFRCLDIIRGIIELNDEFYESCSYDYNPNHYWYK